MPTCRFSSRFAVCALLCLASAALPAQQRVDSLDAVPGVLRTPEAREIWNTQMAGKPAPDHLGTRDLAGLDRRALLDVLLPGTDQGRIRLLGARPWAQYPGHAVALACVAKASRDPNGYRQPETDCETADVTAVLAVLRIDAANAPQLVARVVLDPSEAWPSLVWEGDMPMALDADDESALPQRWDRFDLAAYQLGDGPPTLGLRGSWSEGYSGGGAFYGALYLFELRGDTLVPVFAAPMSMYRDLAGDWNPDGTRQHDIDEWSKVLIVEPVRHDGHHDLRLRERRARSGGQRWRWSASDGRYRPLR